MSENKIQERYVQLKNHKTGEAKDFVLRPFTDKDVEAVIQCVREEYDDTYYRREYYDRDLLLKETGEGGLHLFMAYCGDDVCGIQSMISYAPEETRFEAASQIFRKKYRGYGLPYELVKYTYEIGSSLSPSCIYASTVVFHNITQSMCEDAGMVPVAFNLGSHITSKMHNSYMLGSSEKYAQAILVLPVAKKDAGTVFVHPDIKDTVCDLYSQLGATVDIVSRRPDTEDAFCDKDSSLNVKINEREQSICIRVDTIGNDLIDEVRKIMADHAEKLWTIQLILPVDDRSSLLAYELLVKEGFFFSGLRPLCCEHEQIFMNHTGDVKFCFDDFSLTDRFTKLLDQIKKYHGENR